MDGRILIGSTSQYYTPFVTVKARESLPMLLHVESYVCVLVLADTPPNPAQVLAPNGAEIWQQQNVYSETHFNVPAKQHGAYKICFYNPTESRTDAIVDLVYFTLAHLRTGRNIVVPRGHPDER